MLCGHRGPADRSIASVLFQALDSVIFRDPFQLGIFYDSPVLFLDVTGNL